MPSLTKHTWAILFVWLMAAFALSHWFGAAYGFPVFVSYVIDLLLAAGPFVYLCRHTKKDKKPPSDPYIDDLPVALIVADNDGRITSMNRLARDLCGFSRQEDDTRISQIPYEVDTPLYYLSQTLEGKQLYQEQHYTCQRQDELRYYLLSTVEIIKKGGGPAGAMLIGLPVSEQYFLGRHLSQRGKLAMIGELAAGTAHEIRNPLTSVKGLIQILSRRFTPDDPAREYISVILTEINQINAIIKELLLLARRDTPNLSFVSLPPLLDQVLLMVEGEAACRGIAIQKEYGEELPLMILDEEQIKQVFWHLATNALHAMPQGGKLTVSARYIEGEQAIMIAFEDTGTGISKEHMAQIFHPFFTTRAEGTGLGLPVSYQIIDNHGGKLSVKSTVDKGSIFTVKLPLINYEKPKTP